jgi:hypothetical protein
MEAKMAANQEIIDAWLEEMKARRKKTWAKEGTEACLEKTKFGLEEAAVYIFEGRLKKMDTKELEANRENSDAVAEL